MSYRPCYGDSFLAAVQLFANQVHLKQETGSFIYAANPPELETLGINDILTRKSDSKWSRIRMASLAGGGWMAGWPQGCQVGLSEAKYGKFGLFLNVWPRNF